MTDQTQSVHLRCRFGLHKWARYKIDAEEGWVTRCRYCQKKRRYWFNEAPWFSSGA